MNQKWTEEEISILTKNYPKLGREKCAKLLNRNKTSIHSKATKLKLRLSETTRSDVLKEGWTKRKPKHKSKYKVNVDFFTINFIPESAYVLGFLWADGYLSRKSAILLEGCRLDIKEIYPHFLKTGNWGISYRQRKDRKPAATIHTSNRLLLDFLSQHNYGPKNYGNPTILNIIPKDLHYMWLRGCIDGDGCWYLNLKNKLRQFSLAGAYTQNWQAIQDMLSSLEIRNKSVRRIQNKIHRSSIVRVTDKKSIAKLGEFIYRGFEKDKIGLCRKYEKWKKITLSC